MYLALRIFQQARVGLCVQSKEEFPAEPYNHDASVLHQIAFLTKKKIKLFGEKNEQQIFRECLNFVSLLVEMRKM